MPNHSPTKLIIGYIKCPILLLISGLFVLPFMTSCKGKSTQIKQSVDGDSSFRYAFPKAKALPEKEKVRLNHMCQQWFDSLLGNDRFNGAVLVAKNGEIIFEKYQGTQPIPVGEPINAKTPFHIASVSKTFTGMAVLKLWQEQKIDINQPFSHYFPSFDYPGVTIKTLLNHRSGLPNYLYFMEDLGWNKNMPMSNEDVLHYLISRKKDLKDISKADTHFTYCNTNYILLALLIEKVSGLKYSTYLSRHFFRPLNMNQSFVYSSKDSFRITPSYDWKGERIPLNQLDFTYGDKNIYSTPQDLLQWHLLLNSNQLFSDSTLRSAYTPYSNEKKGIRNYGLGWRMNVYPDGQKLIYHNGWWHGNNAAYIRLPEEDGCIIVLGNRQNRNIYKAKYLVSLFAEGYSQQEDDE